MSPLKAMIASILTEFEGRCQLPALTHANRPFVAGPRLLADQLPFN
jgi:hypothetical protein